ncbi:glycosyltransferase family 4 protein [Qipengyuania sp. JC766]|uniref:glycosyltransferase family 4 protein n=1 Tax=Qipengyuania sp. JC766 TaxID=3232139 RepID=UPI003457F8AE
MKVLFSCSVALSLRNFRGRLLESIRKRGHEVVAIAPDFDHDMLAWCAERGIATDDSPIDGQGLNPLRDLTSLAKLVGTVREHKPDVVLGYTPKPAIYTALAAKLAGVPHVTMMVTGLGYGFMAGEEGWKAKIVPPLVRNLYRAACAACDTVIFHNADNRRTFLDLGILRQPRKAVVVNGSGVDLDHYAPLPFPEVGGPHEIAFLLVGRIVRYKGILEYAKAAARVREKYPQARFLLAGYYDRNPLSYLPEEWAFIEKSLDYLGPQSDVRGVFAQSHVYVLPSYGEGMPRTVLEAMAHGRPVITTETFGCRDTVAEGENGFLVPVKDEIDLADAMIAFLSGNADYDAMGSRSLEIVRDCFEVEKVNADMRAAMRL